MRDPRKLAPWKYSSPLETGLQKGASEKSEQKFIERIKKLLDPPSLMTDLDFEINKVRNRIAFNARNVEDYEKLIDLSIGKALEDQKKEKDLRETISRYVRNAIENNCCFEETEENKLNFRNELFGRQEPKEEPTPDPKYGLVPDDSHVTPMMPDESRVTPLMEDEGLKRKLWNDAIEAAAITAWTHYMDTCKQKNIHPANMGEFIASTSIRKLSK